MEEGVEVGVGIDELDMDIGEEVGEQAEEEVGVDMNEQADKEVGEAGMDEKLGMGMD